MSETTTQVTVEDDNVVTVIFRRDYGGALGIKPVGDDDGYVYVESILEGCMVHGDGRIQPGDRILQVNNTKLDGMSTKEATHFLREITSVPGRIALKVLKISYDNQSRLTNQQISYQDQLPPPRLNMEAWLAYTEEMRPEASIAPTSLYRGHVMPRYGTDTPVVNGSFCMNYSDQLRVVTRMMARDAGLEVKNRMWLKIEIIDAFMGKNLIRWLKDNVEGIDSPKLAKRYAGQLLQVELILPTMGTGTEFSEKAYYTFNKEKMLLEQTHYLSSENLTVNPDLMDDIPDSVSQVAANTDFRFPDSDCFTHPPTGDTLTRRHNSRSSGGSGKSTDRLLRPAVYEEVDMRTMRPYSGPRYTRTGHSGRLNSHSSDSSNQPISSFILAKGKY